MVNVWRKRIPEARDRVQSRALVCCLAPLLLLLCLRSLTSVGAGGRAGAAGSLLAVAVSLVFALAAWKLGSATPGAAGSGGLVCFLLVRAGGGTALRSGLLPLVLLFALTFAATRAGRSRKAKLGLAESRKGRNAAQVLANLGAAGLAAGVGLHPWGFPVLLAALVEATADTVSSEIGQAFGGQPVSMMSLQRVEVGTDGAVTSLGTAAGVAAGTLVAAAGLLVPGVGLRGILVALGCGVAGLFFDSVLGATVERRGWLGNDLVNFASTVFAAVLAFVISA